MATKQEIIKEKLAAYLAADKKEKSRLLDGLEEATSFERSALIRRLRTLQTRPVWWKDGRGGSRIIYGIAVTAALKDVWETASRIGAERLRAALKSTFVYARGMAIGNTGEMRLENCVR